MMMDLFVVLEFNGPVNTNKVRSSQSVHLHVHL